MPRRSKKKVAPFSHPREGVKSDVMAFAYDMPQGEQIITIACDSTEAFRIAADLGLRLLGKVAEAELKDYEWK